MRGLLLWFWRILIDQFFSNIYFVALAIYAFLSAMGVTVKTGQRGLIFTFGRAGTELDAGFRFLVPFVQRAKVVPARSRTLDLDGQRVVTRDGLVYSVHVNLVWRIVDVRRALIEVDDLVHGMRRWLAVAAQQVLRERVRGELRLSEELDRLLEERMQAWLEPWGVRVESAGFPSIAPSKRTVELLQLPERVRERDRVRRWIEGHDGAPGPEVSVLLAGTRRRGVRRQVRARERERLGRERQRAAASGIQEQQASPSLRPKPIPPGSRGPLTLEPASSTARAAAGARV